MVKQKEVSPIKGEIKYENVALFFLAAELAESQFPDQGLDSGHGSESLES